MRLAAYGDCWLRQHARRTWWVDDEYAARPRSSIVASSDDTDHVTDVHWNPSICAQVPVQRSDVHNSNASTCDYAQKTSSVHGEVWCRPYFTKHCFIWLDTQDRCGLAQSAALRCAEQHCKWHLLRMVASHNGQSRSGFGIGCNTNEIT